MARNMGYDSRMMMPEGGLGMMYGGPPMNGTRPGPGDTVQVQDPFSDTPMRPAQFGGQGQGYGMSPYHGSSRGPYGSGFGGENGENSNSAAALSGEYMGETPYRPASAASSSDGYGGGARFRGEGHPPYDQSHDGASGYPRSGKGGREMTPQRGGPPEDFSLNAGKFSPTFTRCDTVTCFSHFFLAMVMECNNRSAT
jgi:hypothetical protein